MSSPAAGGPSTPVPAGPPPAPPPSVNNGIPSQQMAPQLQHPMQTQQQRIISNSSQKRLQELELIEKELTSSMVSAGNALQELGKDKPSMKQVENHASSFLKSLEKVETDLSKCIHYLTQVSSGQSHEGSPYASQKILSMSGHRMEHAKSRLRDLDRVNDRYAMIHQRLLVQQQMAQQQAQQLSTQGLHPQNQSQSQ